VADFPHRLITRIEFAFGADPAGDPDTWTWTDVTSRRQAQSTAVNWGRPNEGARAQNGSVTITLDNLDGALTPDNAASPYYPDVVEGTPVRYSLQWEGVWYTLLLGEAASFEPNWPYGDLSNQATGYQGEARVTVTASGSMRRLSQGTPPLLDALRRHIQDHSPLAYWTLTDGVDAREGSEIVQGGQPMRSIGESGSFFQGQPNWAKGSLAPWLDPVVELPDDTVGRIRARVPKHDVTSWSVDHYMAGAGPGNVLNLTIVDAGQGSDADPVRTWQIDVQHDLDMIFVDVSDRGETTSSITALGNVPDAGVGDGDGHMIRLSTTDDGAGGTDWALAIDGQSVLSGSHAVQNRAVSLITYRWNTQDRLIGGETVEGSASALGHITYWGTAPGAAETYRAFQGHARELAGRRIERLCTEQGVPLQVNGNLDQTPQMGPQKSGAFLGLLQSAADVDGGVLYESRDVTGLEYRTLRSKYNQGVNDG
jgi:hypothetical protein